MKLIFTPHQIKSIDEFAIKTLHIPSLRLMENAGKAVVNEVSSQATNVLIFCGKGNNGGDGFVAARLFSQKKYSVTVVLMESVKELLGDALINYERLIAANINIISFSKFQKQHTSKVGVIIDAMLGTSFRGELKNNYRKAVRYCNKHSVLKIAIDIPTGLNGETGDVLTDAFHADRTVTMSNPKIGFYCKAAKDYTGDVIVANIGIPKSAAPVSNIVLVEGMDVIKTFPKRMSNSHKHSVGKIFVIAGSKSMMGAALLCSHAVLKSGAGQVILGIPDSQYIVAAKRTIEVMPLGLPSTNDGSIALSAKSEIVNRIRWANAVVLGCGLSRNSETQQLIRDIIRSTNKPMVIDADGLMALVGQMDVLMKRKSRHVILTPHLGEFSAMIGIPTQKIEANKFSLAAEFSKKYHVTLVLKGAPTITADPKGKIFINSTGNPGMSTAGSGDVLAGIIASLIGQGNSVRSAAINGVFIHGKAGDRAAATIGIHGMIASDIVSSVPAAIKEMAGI